MTPSSEQMAEKIWTLLNDASLESPAKDEKTMNLIAAALRSYGETCVESFQDELVKDGVKYSANDVKAFKAESRRSALEEAAKVAEEQRVLYLTYEDLENEKLILGCRANSRREIAEAIRALLTPDEEGK
jgi:hypothetical protein